MATLFKKNAIVNIYTPTGILLRTIGNFNDVKFTKSLNGGLSECAFQTDMKFDYGGSDLLLFNEVEIRITDGDTVTQQGDAQSRIIYTGYISMIEREANAKGEMVTIHALGYYSLLALDVLKNGSQTTLYSNTSAGLTATLGSQGAADVSLMVRAIIQQYLTNSVNPRISWDAQDIPLTGTTATYSFEQMTYADAIDALRGMAPSGTYWYVNERNKLTFKPKSATPIHKFVFGKHFSIVHVEHSLEKVRNGILLWNGQTGAGSIYTHTEDAASIGMYGRRIATDNNYGMANSNASTLLATRFLADNKTPDVKVTVTIVDNNLALDDKGDQLGYDIESIQPGDTCSFYGFSPGFDDIFRDNMIITSVDYSFDTAVVTIEIVKSSLDDLNVTYGKQIDALGTGGIGIPTTYT